MQFLYRFIDNGITYSRVGNVYLITRCICLPEYYWLNFEIKSKPGTRLVFLLFIRDYFIWTFPNHIICEMWNKMVFNRMFSVVWKRTCYNTFYNVSSLNSKISAIFFRSRHKLNIKKDICNINKCRSITAFNASIHIWRRNRQYKYCLHPESPLNRVLWFRWNVLWYRDGQKKNQWNIILRHLKW